jgi:hypothetical protein
MRKYHLTLDWHYTQQLNDTNNDAKNPHFHHSIGIIRLWIRTPFPQRGSHFIEGKEQASHPMELPTVQKPFSSRKG